MVLRLHAGLDFPRCVAEKKRTQRGCHNRQVSLPCAAVKRVTECHFVTRLICLSNGTERTFLYAFLRRATGSSPPSTSFVLAVTLLSTTSVAWCRFSSFILLPLWVLLPPLFWVVLLFSLHLGGAAFFASLGWCCRFHLLFGVAAFLLPPFWVALLSPLPFMFGAAFPSLSLGWCCLRPFFLGGDAFSPLSLPFTSCGWCCFLPLIFCGCCFRSSFIRVALPSRFFSIVDLLLRPSSLPCRWCWLYMSPPSLVGVSSRQHSFEVKYNLIEFCFFM